MLAMVPGYSLNARFMEQMMGVKERFDLTENYQMSKAKAWFRTFVMGFNMIALQVKLPKDRMKFTKFVSGVFEEYQNYDYVSMPISEMIENVALASSGESTSSTPARRKLSRKLR